MTSEVYVAVERSDGSVAHIAVQLEARMPAGMKAIALHRLVARGWHLRADGVWERHDTDVTLEREVRRFEAEQWLPLDGISVVSWKRLSAEEHEKFNEHRNHRDALEMVGGVIQHNMPKARELHRQLLRHQRAEKLLVLDGAYNGAVAQGDTVKAAAIETKRQELRDLTDDPRIDAAKDIGELVQVGFTEDGEAALADTRAFVKGL